MAASVEFQGVQTITPMTDHGGPEGYVRLTNSGAAKVESTIQMFTPQQYCLRWNNHRTNLLTVFDQLLQNEAFTDVTLACEGGTSVKCHKMVLAACSSYFQVLFTDLPCRHPVVILKDVKYTEIKAILEYMYRGEVNVAQDQLAALLKVAEALKVKGLVEENGAGAKPREEEPNMITTSTAAAPPPAPQSSNDSSPPHSTGIHPQSYPKAPYLYNKSPSDRSNNGGGGRLSMPMWGVPGLPLPTPPPASPHTAAVLNSCYEAAMNYRDMPPLRRKKLSSLLMSRGDTPILRTVLGQGQGQGQGQADSSQPMPLICHPDSQDGHGSPRDGDKTMKTELSEDAPSPYTDISFKDEEMADQNNRMMMPYSSPQSGNGDSKVYVPPQKPEWKRYKQYTRNDIMSAIDAVRGGMSALQAARKYGVPSRTLYDKVKKLGITTGRPFRRSSIGNGGPGFPYNFSGGSGGGGGGGGIMLMGPDEPANFAKDEGGSGLPPYADHPFLHHALEYRNDTSEATATQQSNHSNHSSSPNGRSPSPTLIRYAHPRSVTPSPPPPDEDRVEDLSMKPEPPSRVIMPPMSQAVTAGDNDTRD